MKTELHKYLIPFLLGVVAAAIIMTVVGALPQRASAQAEGEGASEDGSSVSTTTVLLIMDKAISGDGNGFVESDFYFTISGNGVNETVGDGGSVALGVGTYTIEEIVPNGFVKTDWRIGWYGECEAGSDWSTTITIDEGNVDHGTLDCQADNQYRPKSDSGDNGGGNGGDDDVEGCTDPLAENYNPDATVEDGSCTYDNGGGNGGGNGTSTDQYRIQGYVWHDADKNGEIATDTESYLGGWTVTATNGTTTMSTTTDENGYYYFDVEAGTWTISEILMTSWTQSFPADNQHVVTVPEESEEVVLGFPLNLFFYVAHAAVVETFGDYNFGNYFTGDSGGGNGGNNDDGGGSTSGNGGGSIAGGCYDCAGGSGGTPQVLGEQVAAIPALAPFAGHGGASLHLPSFLAFAWPLLAWLGF